MRRYANRSEAGKALGAALKMTPFDSPVVFALPRGGAPVAAMTARALEAPFDFLFVRKLGAPGNMEFAIGAVADGAAPAVILHQAAIDELGVSDEYVEHARMEALAEIERRRNLFRPLLPPQDAKGRTAILVDDGLATGATMEAAIMSARNAGAKKIVVAVPTAPASLISKLRTLADDVVCLDCPAPFIAVGAAYDDFRQLTDDDLAKLTRQIGEDGRFRRQD